MLADLLLIVVAGVGVDVGWTPTPDGRIEYIIQVTPEEIENLNLGDIIAASDVPQGFPPIAAYRIVVGRNPLPRELPAHSAMDGVSATGGDGSATPSTPKSVDHTAQPAVAVFPAESKQLPAPPMRVGSDEGAKGVASGGSNPPVQQNTGSKATRTGGVPAVTESGQTSSTQWRAPWVITTSVFAVCLAGLVFATWAAADYRKKYRQLLEKLPITDGSSPGFPHSNELPQKSSTVETQPSSADG